jgi:hypothetical protein
VEEAIDLAKIEEEGVPVDPSPVVEAKIPDEPGPTDPGWQDFVLSHFTETDLDSEGNPYAHSLRIVAEKLLGPITRTLVRTVQTPNDSNGYRATVEVSVAFAWGGDREDIRIFEDVADVYSGNTPPKFARFAPSSAKTKAEGRALCSALKLRKVYAAEEMTDTPVSEAGLDGMIVLTQQRFIDAKCNELDIDVNKFISMGDFRYKHISNVPFTTAKKMIERLNVYQQDKGKIPDALKGYNPDWRKEK